MDAVDRYAAEPLTLWTPIDFDAFLIWCADSGVSDIKLNPNSPPYIRLHGRWITACERGVTTTEIGILLDHFARNSSASAQVVSGKELDFGHEIKVDRERRQRFRGNAIACRDGVGVGISVVLRSIPGVPPPLASLGLDQEIIDALYPDSGIVFITGVMGSGKSTTLSSALAHMSQTQRRTIDTFESPIEFNLEDVPDRLVPVTQSEIPTHLANFRAAIHAVTRRASDVVLVGESRDPETMRGLIESAETGVAAYTTLHTRSVPESPSRVINMFPETERPAIAATLLAAMRLIVYQRLVPKAGGGRVALREYLVFSEAHRRRLVDTPIDRLIPVLTEIVEQDGQTLLQDAERKHAEGLIDNETIALIRHARA